MANKDGLPSLELYKSSLVFYKSRRITHEQVSTIGVFPTLCHERVPQTVVMLGDEKNETRLNRGDLTELLLGFVYFFPF